MTVLGAGVGINYHVWGLGLRSIMVFGFSPNQIFRVPGRLQSQAAAARGVSCLKGGP